MSNNESKFNPDCAEDERNMRPTPVTDGKAIGTVTAEIEQRHREQCEAKRTLFISEEVERSANRMADIFKRSWTKVKERYPEDSIAVRLMTFHRATAEAVGATKSALLDLVMSQINSTILPLLSEEERKELDRVTIDDVLNDIVNCIIR